MSRYRVLSVVLGLVAAFASAMKYLSITEASINPDLLGRAWWQGLAGLVLEIGLALWLLAGVFPQAARWLSLGAFGLFAVLSFTKGIAGEESCGCFGALRVNPWARARPPSSRWPPSTPRSSTIRRSCLKR